jgi:nucleoside-diphosphate-sugar epimerase
LIGDCGVTVRHVILGSDTTLGSSILRVLVSIGNQEIVCCNPDGIIPTDIPTTNITTFNVDIRNMQMLEAILQEGDIIYNAQIYDDENILSLNFDNLHVTGLKNLLHIANQKKIKKIVSYLPQKISWDIPDNATEETELIPSTKYQKSLHKTLEAANLYFSQELFKDGNSSTQEVLHLDPPDDVLEVEELTESEPADENKNQDRDNNTEDTEVIEEDEGVDHPSLAVSPPSLSPSPPSLAASPPSLTTSSEDQETSNPETTESEDQPKSKDEDHSDDDEEPSLSEEMLEFEDIGYDVPLVIARISRFYGPFDYSITKKVCQSVRLQRMKVIGRLKKKISWINPLDAGRAMIIMADEKVKQGQYNINGFEATGVELIAAMDEINHSKTRIRRRLYLFSNFIVKFKLILSKLGFVNRIALDEIYGLNKTQVYSDEKARESWKWKPKYNLRTTSKDSLNWFVNHVL